LKYPASHKQEIRQKLLDSASMQVRDVGLDKVSVKSVMESNEMTIGGFYSHFSSKEDLLNAAIEHAFKITLLEHYDTIEDLGDDAWNKKVIRRYLSKPHRDIASLSCPAATLMSDVSRAKDDVRATFEKSLKQLLKRFEPRIGKGKSIALFALLSGGLLMARAAEDKKYSDKILKECIKGADMLIKNN